MVNSHQPEKTDATPDLSVVILTHNNRELLRSCLLSISRHTRKIKTEIIIVDNASQDGTGEMIKKDFVLIRQLKKRS